MKGLYCGILLLLVSFAVSAQTITSTSTGGNWNSTSTWVGGVIPDYSNSTSIVIAGPVTIPSGYTATVDQLTINVSRALTVALGGILHLQDDGTAGAELTFQTGFGTAVLNVNGRLVVGNGATVQNATSTRLKVLSTGVYEHQYADSPGTIYLSGWSTGSTLLISGYTTPGGAPSGLNQSFYNVTWNCPAQADFIDLDGGLVTVLGDLVISNTNSNFLVLTQSTNYTLNISGDLEIDGTSAVAFNGFVGGTTSTINISDSLIYTSDVDSWISVDGVATLNVQNDFVVNSVGALDFVSSTGSTIINLKNDLRLQSGELKNSGVAATADIRFNGTTDAQLFINAGTINDAINFQIDNGAIVDFATYAATGSGAFTLQAGATMKVGSPDGLASGTTSGNIRVSGTRTYVADANIIYNSSGAQNLGNEWGSGGALNGVAVNLEIANTNTAGVTNNIIGSTSLVGDLTLTSNPLHIGNSNTLIIQSNFTATGGTIGGVSTSNLTFSGSGTITGNLNFATGSQNLNNLTISRDATITLGTPLTIGGTLSFTEAGELRFYDQNLTINGDITQTGGGASGGLECNSTSNLIIGGTGPLSTLPFVNSSQLNNLTLGRTSGGTYTLGSSITVNGTLALNAGTLTHSSGLIMANGSTFSRSAGATITTNAPTAIASYNVSYTGALTTGLELPSTATALNNLTVAGNATLDKAVTVNGDININSGTLDASTFNLTMSGAAFNANGGTFTINAANTVTFSRAGTTSLAGTTIGGTQFGNLTINSGATVSAPNSNINVSGTWNNLGAFSPNAGTVTFNGTNQSLDPNGQPFYNVTFANSGTKTLAGILDANGTLTINTGVTLDAAAAENTIYVAGTWSNAGTFTASGNTVIFDGTAGQTITEAGSFHNLQLAGSGTKTLGAALDVDGELLIASGVTFSTNASSYAISLAGNWTNNGSFTAGTAGTVTFNGNTTIGGTSTTRFRNVSIAGVVTAPAAMQVAGNWSYTSGTFNANSGTVTFDGSANQSIAAGGQSFYNLVIAGGNTKTIQSNTDINGNLTLNSGSTFSLGLDRTVTLAGNFDASPGGTLNAAAGLFVFDGGNQTITSAGEVFYSTSFAGTGTKSLADALDVNGSIAISSALAAGSNTINVAGNWNATGGTFTSTGTTTLDGAAQNILTNNNPFGTLVVSGSGTKTLQGALDVNDDLTISSTLDVSASNFGVTVGGDWDASVGNFTPHSGTVTFDGAAQNVTPGASSFHSLSVAGTGVKTLLGALDVNGNLTFSNGTSGLDVGAHNAITIAGNWVNNSGTTAAFTAASGKVTFDGNATSDVSGTGTTQFYSIDVTGNTNVEIESTHSIRGTLTLVGVSSRFNAAGSGNAGIFTLISSDDDPTVDARIAALPDPSNFTGEVTVQRFMSQESMPSSSNNRLYRYISSPVANATVSEIQTEIPITGTFTGASTCSGCGTNPSMYAYDEAIGSTFDDGWVAFPSVSNTETLAQGAGYGIFVRGNIIPSALWDVRGTIFSGNVNLPVTYNPQGVAGADGFNLVGNPYPAPIDWDLIHPSSTNIADAVYIRDNANGRYTMYVNGVGTNGGTKDIAMGQGFWVEATGSNPSLPLTESMKSSASSTTFFRVADPSDLLRIQVANGSLSDETVIRFLEEATDQFDAKYDAWKLQNTIFNLSSVLTDSTNLAINTLGAIDCGREIKLDISNVTTGHYDLNLSGGESFSDQVSIRLVDSYLDQVVDAKTTSVYGFNVDTNIPETFGAERFKVIFEFSTSVAQPEVFATDVCAGADASLEIANTASDVQYAVYSNNTLVKDIGAGTGANMLVSIPEGLMISGENVFELRAMSSFCSEISINQEFTIVNEDLPEITEAKGGKSCLSGTVTLEAAGAEEGNYRWYESPDSPSPVAGATGSIFTTPELTKTSTFYVAAMNRLGCEGPRVEVKAEVILFDPVVIEVTEGQLVSSYSEGNQWFKDGELIAGATGKTFTPVESGTYTVEVNLGECTTSAQQEFLVTANEEFFSNGRMNVYPNPVKDMLVIESKFEQKEAPVIFDQAGRSIGTVQMKESPNGWIGTFDFSDRTKGLYLLKVMEKGIPRFKRIIRK